MKKYYLKINKKITYKLNNKTKIYNNYNER